MPRIAKAHKKKFGKTNHSETVRMPRDIRQLRWFCDPDTVKMFICLLFFTQEQNEQGRGNEQCPGQLIIKYDELLKKLEYTKERMETAMRKLENVDEARFELDGDTLIVKLLNYQMYCGD